MDNSLPGAEKRRRVHLMRHGDVSYVTETGDRVPDAELVELTATGQRQAQEMAEVLRNLQFDRTICSGLIRTRQTAAPIVAGRGLELEEYPALKEIKSGGVYPEPPSEGISEHVYIMDRVAEPGLRWAGGELIAEFRQRVLTAFLALLVEPGWNSMLLVAHGMVNRAILSWVAHAGIKGMGGFEQATCCLNIIDVDVDGEKILRRLARQINVTPDNVTKSGEYQTSFERGHMIWRERQQRNQAAE